MKKFRFISAILALMLVFGLALASCGGGDGSNNTPDGHDGTPGLLFFPNGNGYDVGKGTVLSGAVVIPTIYNGLPVTRILGDKFANTAITSIIIPSSVTYIQDSAFSDCTSLTSVTIPSSVTFIGVNAFYKWTSSQTINIQSHASQASADAAWGDRWRSGCNAQINYQGGLG